MEEITLKKIAKKLNVSVSTVSRALSGKSGVSEKLKKKIIDTAEALGYRPNRCALGLRKNKTKLIGVLVPEMSGTFFAEIISSIEKVLFHLGYRLLLCSTEDNPEKEAEQLKVLLQQRVEGILAAPVKIKENSDLYSTLIKNYKIPVVFFDRLVEGVNTNYVISDNKEGMKILIDYLVSKGHKNIGLIHPLKGTFTGEERLKSFLEYKDIINLNYDWIKDGGSTEEEAYHAFLNIMKARYRPTAIVVGNNLMTLGVLKAIKELALKVPNDISVVSFDDAYWNEIFDPPITSVTQDPKQIGLISATILLDKLKNKKSFTELMQIVLKTKFIERASVKNLRYNNNS